VSRGGPTAARGRRLGARRPPPPSSGGQAPAAATQHGQNTPGSAGLRADALDDHVVLPIVTEVVAAEEAPDTVRQRVLQRHVQPVLVRRDEKATPHRQVHIPQSDEELGDAGGGTRRQGSTPHRRET